MTLKSETVFTCGFAAETCRAETGEMSVLLLLAVAGAQARDYFRLMNDDLPGEAQFIDTHIGVS